MIKLCDSKMTDPVIQEIILKIDMLSTPGSMPLGPSPTNFAEYTRMVQSYNQNVDFENKQRRSRWDCYDILSNDIQNSLARYNLVSTNYNESNLSETYQYIEVTNDINAATYILAPYATGIMSLFKGAPPGAYIGDMRSNIKNFDLQVVTALLRMCGQVEVFSISFAIPLTRLMLYNCQIFTNYGSNVPHMVENMHYVYSTATTPDANRWPLSSNRSGVAVVVNAKVIDLTAYADILSGNRTDAGALNWLTPGDPDELVTAIVPVTAQMAKDANLMAWWTLAFMEYPYRQYYRTATRIVDNLGVAYRDGAGLGAQFVPTSEHFGAAAGVRLRGPRTNVLYVLVDINSAATVNVITVLLPGPTEVGGYFDVAPPVDIGPALDSVFVDASVTVINAAMIQWNRFFGGLEDWKDAIMCVSTVTNLLCDDKFTDNEDDGTVNIRTIRHGNNRANAASTAELIPGPQFNYGEDTTALGLLSTQVDYINRTSVAYAHCMHRLVEVQNRDFSSYALPQFSDRLAPFSASKHIQAINPIGDLQVSTMYVPYISMMIGVQIAAFFSHEIVNNSISYPVITPHNSDWKAGTREFASIARHYYQVLFHTAGFPDYGSNLNWDFIFLAATGVAWPPTYQERIYESGMTANRVPMSVYYKITQIEGSKVDFQFDNTKSLITRKNMGATPPDDMVFNKTWSGTNINWDLLCATLNWYGTQHQAEYTRNLIQTYDSWFNAQKVSIRCSPISKIRSKWVYANITPSSKYNAPLLVDAINGLGNWRWIDGYNRYMFFGLVGSTFMTIMEDKERASDPVLYRGKSDKMVAILRYTGLNQGNSIFNRSEDGVTIMPRHLS
jgi:hypothetical protein